MYAKSAYSVYKDSEILNLLLKLDVSILKKDYAGKSVIDYCIENNEVDEMNFIKGYL